MAWSVVGEDPADLVVAAVQSDAAAVEGLRDLLESEREAANRLDEALRW